MGSRQPLQNRPNTPPTSLLKPARRRQEFKLPHTRRHRAGVGRRVPPTKSLNQSRVQLPPACACNVPDSDFNFAPLWQRVMVSKT
jgi:hypothetical protein